MARGEAAHDPAHRRDGYIGSHLLERLEAEGRSVRALSRSPEKLEGRVGADTETVAGDLEDSASLVAALDGVEGAYYLAHSLATDADFAERERRSAVNFAEAAVDAGVGRIVYLGGLGGADDELSPHLASRHEVGKILRESGMTTAELRASIVIGPGSASYDLLLVAGFVSRPDADVRGVRGLTRAIVPVPSGADVVQGLIEAAASEQVTLWLRLLESMRNDTAAHDDAARRDFPGVEPRGVEQALSDAVAAVPPA